MQVIKEYALLRNHSTLFALAAMKYMYESQEMLLFTIMPRSFSSVA